jgi:hypothetical protein
VLGGKVLADAPDFIDYGVPRHKYSPMSSSGVQMTGHSHACSRQINASALTLTAFAMCTQFPSGNRNRTALPPGLDPRRVL